MQSPTGPLSFKSHAATKPPWAGKKTRDQEETWEDWVNGATKESTAKIKIPGTLISAWPPAVWEGRQGTGQGNNTDQKSKTGSPRGEGHLESHITQ